MKINIVVLDNYIMIFEFLNFILKRRIKDYHYHLIKINFVLQHDLKLSKILILYDFY
jgi:hypothetical protein